MGYVAVKGGIDAIENACKAFQFERLKGSSAPLGVDQIREQLFLLVDRVMGEGSLYAPELAALAVRQAAGDTLEAAFLLRAYRTTRPRLGYSVPQPSDRMRVVRRISAAFKDVPGGQVLGSTNDYTLRLLNFDVAEGSRIRKMRLVGELLRGAASAEPLPDTFPRVIDILRRENLIAEAPRPPAADAPFDVTKDSLQFPAPRSAALQTLARGETGGLLLLAYSNMRGYGNIHPTIGELRVGYLPLTVRHPLTGESYTAGEVKVTEAEILAKFTDITDGPRFTVGYGLCFGHNEVKAIAMAILDRSIQSAQGASPSEDGEFVLSHVDGIESMGFCNHWKLPHYVDFQSDLDRLRRAKEIYDAQRVDQQKKT
ncbi:MAG: carbon-phosphorus lyase complex subunit PhnI [Syntrophaceae bacterium]|nr:carbon-phosphorus lyase complex subunit PhnI [Syntrophaceae bacterium]